MKLAVWKMQLVAHQEKVKKAEAELYDAKEAREKFMLETVGFRANDIATLPGMVEMIEKVIEMKAEA